MLWVHAVHCDVHYLSCHYAMFICEQFITVTTLDWSVGSPKTWIIFVIVLFVFGFMQCIYNYMPQTNLVCRIYCFAAMLYLDVMVHVMLSPMFNVLYFYISTSRSMCAVPRMDFFFVVPWFRSFPVYCSGIVWVILSWFQLSLLLLVHYYYYYYYYYHHHHHHHHHLHHRRRLLCLSSRQRCKWNCWNNFSCTQRIKEWNRFNIHGSAHRNNILI